MIHEIHDLLHELPEHADRIRALQVADPSFFEQMANYDQLDRQIQEAEMSGTPVDDMTFEELKKQRLAIKDSLYERILQD